MIFDLFEESMLGTNSPVLKDKVDSTVFVMLFLQAIVMANFFTPNS